MQHTMQHSLCTSGMRCKPGQLFLRPRASIVRPLAARRFIVRAAASDSSQDPYKALGLPNNADYETIQRTYRRKVNELKGNDAEIAKLEAAHSQLMMAALSSRLQGGAKVSKDIAFADRPQYFPWRPRLFLAEKKVILYSGAVQVVLLAWSLLTSVTAGTQPVIASAVVGAVTNIYKLNQIFPSTSGMGATDAEKQQGVKNILRGMFLAFLATVAGVFVSFTLPDLVASWLNRTMPFWFYESQATLLSVGTVIFNFIMSSFYR